MQPRRDASVQDTLFRPQHLVPTRDRRLIERVIVDLTPLLPEGINGGAKPMTLELLHRLVARSPQTKFVLLSLQRSAEELTVFSQPNIQRIIVDSARDSDAARLVRLLARPLAPPPRRGLARYSNALWAKVKSSRFHPNSPARQFRNSVLFSPFTAPLFSESAIPMVCIIYDLQYLDYPQFFNEQARAERQGHFRDACALADRLVCISDYVRGRVLEASGLPPDRVITVHTRLAGRLRAPSATESDTLLARLQLKPLRYLLYPANFWKHKNHEMLLLAMGLFNQRVSDSDLKLVCTGARDERFDFIRSAAQRLGLENRIVFPGYVNEPEFAALMHGCRAMIYPSLYEGFGMPVVEAQAIGKPVLCSNLTSLPEVTGGVARFFDPKLPESIFAAIRQIDSDAGLRQELIARGQANASRFADSNAMADEYLNILLKAIRNHRPGKRPATSAPMIE